MTVVYSFIGEWTETPFLLISLRSSGPYFNLWYQNTQLSQKLSSNKQKKYRRGQNWFKRFRPLSALPVCTLAGWVVVVCLKSSATNPGRCDFMLTYRTLWCCKYSGTIKLFFLSVSANQESEHSRALHWLATAPTEVFRKRTRCKRLAGQRRRSAGVEEWHVWFVRVGGA